MRVLPGVAEAILVAAEEARLDRAERSVDIVAAADQLRGAQAVLGVLFDEAAGVEDRHDQRAGGVRVGVDEGAGSAEDLFRVVRPDRLTGGDGEALALVHGQGAPGPPAQNPSMRPAWRWPTICAGGTTTLCTSSSGCRPMLASQ